MTTDWREKHVLTKGQKTGRNWSAYYSGAHETIFTRFLWRTIREMVSKKLYRKVPGGITRSLRT